MAEIKNLLELLQMNLTIPDYQRPYKWNNKNIEDLLSDISDAIIAKEKYGENFKYRIGSIILYKNKEDYEIVDGQQRIISLVLIKKFLDDGFRCSILKKHFDNKITQYNIHNNYRYIKEQLSIKNEKYHLTLNDAFENLLEVVVIEVSKQNEAFQLFDSQNTRGKSLAPHDLLKAYHLRAMNNSIYEMEHTVEKWESQNTKEIGELFNLFLFPIFNWVKKSKTSMFTEKKIEFYKGVYSDSQYRYAKKTFKSMPIFQISEPFIAGIDFFNYVHQYLIMLSDIKREINSNKVFSEIKAILDTKDNQLHLSKELFYCILLCYYDRFSNFDELVVKKLFTWAYMIRIDMEVLGFKSINKYAIAEKDNNSPQYTNSLPLFSIIVNARKHTEVSNVYIKCITKNDEPAKKKFENLYNQIKEINGVSSLCKSQN